MSTNEPNANHPDADTPTTDDLDVITPTGEDLTVGGMRAEVKPLRMRELMAFSRVISSGLGPAVSSVRPGADGWNGFEIGALVAVAIPNAIDEFCAFLTEVVVAKNPAERGAMGIYLNDNPDISELLDVVGVILSQERENFGALGKQFTAVMNLVTGTLPAKTTSPTG